MYTEVVPDTLKRYSKQLSGTEYTCMAAGLLTAYACILPLWHIYIPASLASGI